MTDENRDFRTGRELLAYYADRGYTVDDVAVEQTVPETRPKRAEVTVELTLTEPVSSVLDRLEAGADGESRR